jgi:DNA repair exonuclease SbcCD ATPase subunit
MKKLFSIKLINQTKRGWIELDTELDRVHLLIQYYKIMQFEDSKVLARKIIKFEELTKKSGEYQKKLEDEIKSLKSQLKHKTEIEELLKLEISKTKRNFNSLQSAYSKLNHEHLTLLDKNRIGKCKKQELSQSLRMVESRLYDEQMEKSKKKSEKMTSSFHEEVSGLKQQLTERDWINQQNYLNLQNIKEELMEQLKIAKSSEVTLRKSLEKLQNDFLEKEKILKGYDERYKLAEESLMLFYVAVKNKEDQINSEKV